MKSNEWNGFHHQKHSSSGGTSFTPPVSVPGWPSSETRLPCVPILKGAVGQHTKLRQCQGTPLSPISHAGPHVNLRGALQNSWHMWREGIVVAPPYNACKGCHPPYSQSSGVIGTNKLALWCLGVGVFTGSSQSRHVRGTFPANCSPLAAANKKGCFLN